MILNSNNMYTDYIFHPTYYAPFGYFKCQSWDTVMKQNNQFVDTIRVNNRPQENVKRQKNIFLLGLFHVNRQTYILKLDCKGKCHILMTTLDFKLNSNHYMSVFKPEKLTCWLAKVTHILRVLFVRMNLVVCWKCNWSTRLTKH